ncbi:cytochrome c oxidase subunit II [Streptomyces sp. NPDC018693]|uniref:cytochrome c oxidase subunit II n=1 Tax=unclassified Streptomyces TaxID=2593676 RepID=UPI003792796A
MNTRHIFGTVFAVESVIATVVFVVVLALLLLAVVRRRAGSGRPPSQRLERMGLEKVYVVALTAVAAFLVGYTAWQNHEEHRAPRQRPVRIDVTSFQWCWTFTHRRPRDPVRVTGTCRDGDLPTLVVPAGRPVTLHLTSRDVIHSLWVPRLRYKMDAFPHHENTFTVTVDRAGRWIGRCAEFCGDRHYVMDFWLKAVEPEEYDTWLAEQHRNGTPA